jgi:WD40 repeat protein
VGPVTAVRWGQSSGGKSQLASCGDDGSVRVWDVEAGACVHVFDEHNSVSWRELARAGRWGAELAWLWIHLLNKPACAWYRP